jgi:hypothetical protein
MTRNPRPTFEEIVLAVAPKNAHTLEEKARRAGELAGTYPERALQIKAIENRLLCQLWCVNSQLRSRVRYWETDQDLPQGLQFLPGQEPLDAFPEFPRSAQQDFGSHLRFPLLVAGELTLAHTQPAGELLLGQVESPEFAEPSADRFPIDRRFRRGHEKKC